MHKGLTRSLLCLTLCAGFASTQASADITITGFQMSNNGISLRVTGTLPQTEPLSSPHMIFLTNVAQDWAFIFSWYYFDTANASTFSGTQSLSAATAGSIESGDYLFWMFNSNLSIGDTFSGTLTAAWDTNILHPEYMPELSKIQLYWGTDHDNAPAAGVFLTDLASIQEPHIPEPSTVALIGAGAAAALVLAVRHRRNKA